MFVPFPYFYLLLKNVKIKSFGFCLVSTTVYFSPFSFVCINKVGSTDAKRVFFMENALVIGLVEGFGKALSNKRG